MRLLKRRRKRIREPGELDITAFMNLMVVLVPFLLITAVFSRIAVHELTLPGPSADDHRARGAAA
jgi:biopolymer transport protein ExbD